MLIFFFKKKTIVSSMLSQTCKFYRSSNIHKSLASTLSKKQPPSRGILYVLQYVSSASSTKTYLSLFVPSFWSQQKLNFQPPKLLWTLQARHSFKHLYNFAAPLNHSASSAVTFLMAHVFFPTVSLLQMMLPRRTMRPKARVSAHNHFLETPCSTSIFLRSHFAAQLNKHSCTGQEVPSSFMMSPSSGMPSMSSMDPSADAAQASKSRGHLHTAELAYPHPI